MNTPLTNQKNNTLFFLGSIAISAVLLAASGFFAKSILTGSTGSIAPSVKACTAVMRVNGFAPQINKDGSLIASISAETGIEAQVYKIGVIMASCPTYTLHDFCAGAGCLTPGVFFTLKPKEL